MGGGYNTHVPFLPKCRAVILTVSELCHFRCARCRSRHCYYHLLLRTSSSASNTAQVVGQRRYVHPSKSCSTRLTALSRLDHTGLSRCCCTEGAHRGHVRTDRMVIYLQSALFLLYGRFLIIPMNPLPRSPGIDDWRIVLCFVGNQHLTVITIDRETFVFWSNCWYNSQMGCIQTAFTCSLIREYMMMCHFPSYSSHRLTLR